MNIEKRVKLIADLATLHPPFVFPVTQFPC